MQAVNGMKRPALKRIALLMAVIAVIAALRLGGIGKQLTLENIQSHAADLRAFCNAHYLESVLAYILVYIVVTGFSLPGALVLTLAGGYLYSTLPAAVYVNIGATAGACISFLFARYIAGTWLQQKYADKLARFNSDIERNGPNYLLTLRLAPIFPFFLVNIFGGLTSVSLKTFAWTTSLGILPGSLVYAYAGRQLGTIHDIHSIFTGRILAAFVLLAAIALLPTVIRKLGRKRQ
jgi:uncharacterized membrane protein YdjX (TVP38/TMEM64 family)